MNNLQKFWMRTSLALTIVFGIGVIGTRGSTEPTVTPTITVTHNPTRTPEPTGTYSPSLATSIATGECLQSFDTFAYQGWRDIRRELKFPGAPWQMEAKDPDYNLAGYERRLGTINVAASRVYNGSLEIWLSSAAIVSNFGTKEPTIVISIYRPERKEWEYITGQIQETSIDVRHFFATSDGTIWAATTDGEHPLAKFNEVTRRFDIVENSPKGILPIANNGPLMLLDKQDNFWLFLNDEGIFTYNTKTQTSEKQRFDLSQIHGGISDAAFSIDGSLFLSTDKDRSGSIFDLSEQALYQLFPATGKIVPIALPTPVESWPAMTGLLVDHNGRLYIGASGYREPDGTWHLMHTHIKEFFAQLGGVYFFWSVPYPVLESSDGLIWFQKFNDSSGMVEGTAWYDPRTGDGCLVTNIIDPRNIIEDPLHQLWLAANGKLFKRPVKP